MGRNQSAGLIIASITQGWDPTKIYPDGESIANFDQKRENIEYQGNALGKLPGGTPNGWPDDTGNPPTPSPTARDFEIGADEDNVKRGTTNADPYAGMGGTALGRK